MAATIANIYQFKITLWETSPKIWRRIQVPEQYSFRDLHVAIQDAMGWMGGHMHQFETIDPKTGEIVLIGVPYGEGNVVPEETAKIASYFLSPKDGAGYEYDFGDSWEHVIILEKILPAVAKTRYPRCIAGKRACPPEDCGGTPGFENFLKIIANPNHEEYKEYIEWLGYVFNPAYFDPKSVRFRHPKGR